MATKTKSKKKVKKPYKASKPKRKAAPKRQASKPAGKRLWEADRSKPAPISKSRIEDDIDPCTGKPYPKAASGSNLPRAQSSCG